MKIAILSALSAAALFFAPTALASPTDSGVANNPGLQQNCAFNPAFSQRHKSACADVSVESVASNGGYQAPEEQTS